MKSETLKTVLKLSDANVPVATIAAAVGLTQGRVYAVLRVERPDRPRTLRARTSDKRAQIVGLRLEGFQPARIAVLIGCRRQYVYRVLGEAVQR